MTQKTKNLKESLPSSDTGLIFSMRYVRCTILKIWYFVRFKVWDTRHWKGVREKFFPWRCNLRRESVLIKWNNSSNNFIIWYHNRSPTGRIFVEVKLCSETLEFIFLIYCSPSRWPPSPKCRQNFNMVCPSTDDMGRCSTKIRVRQ